MGGDPASKSWVNPCTVHPCRFPLLFACRSPICPFSSSECAIVVDEAPVTEEEPPTVSIIDVMPTNCALLFGSRKHLPKRKGNGCGL
ncbi:uncharacterized protein [Oryza sativa Japonica Group]|uniref:uncharacterized protein n=1 Tax=Oryza sativa subsp. japonica TaxID=39947 RepID=UPI0007753FA7|nr:uncharacterized protein LOC107280071 isoform X2 [Oryza sativa Japonica Group]